MCIADPQTPPSKRCITEAACFDETQEPATKRCKTLAATQAPADPFRPYPMIGREAECAVLDRFLKHSLGQKPGSARGGTLYVSGGPGTGKTSSASAAVTEWQRSRPQTKLVYVNCMRLEQRSVAGLLRHLAQAAPADGSPAPAAADVPSQCSLQALSAAAAARMAQLGQCIVLVVDEVDQLVKKTGKRSLAAAGLESVFTLPQLAGAPGIAIIAIANAVDLLEGSGLGTFCSSLLFKPYSVEQLRSIVKSQFAAAGNLGVSAETLLGRVSLELQLRQVAKRSGDCRHIVRLCESALGEAEAAQEDNEADSGAASPPKRELKKTSSYDPLEPVGKLPMEQQVLLCVLATGTSEVEKLPSVCTRFKDFMKRLHQQALSDAPIVVGNSLSALEQQGLLTLSIKRGRGGSEQVIELAVSRKALTLRLGEVNASLKQCLV